MNNAMSKTALIAAIETFDVERCQAILRRSPALERLQIDKGYNLLQYCCKRVTAGKPDAAGRQLRLARWLVGHGFDPKVIYTTAPGEDGEEESAGLSLVWFAVAKAQNNRLARYLLDQGAKASAMFAAAWWGNADIIADLVQHGDDPNAMVGATPFHMAVDVLHRGTERKPELARRRLKTLKEMLRLGADPNLASVDGTTPLHTVLKKEYEIDVFKLLLQYGASPDVPGKDGRTVREIAAKKRDSRYFKALSTRRSNRQ
jgi:hypothetical protein